MMLFRTSCDECGLQSDIVAFEPCPRCGARERRAPTKGERDAERFEAWTAPIFTAFPTRLPRAYIAKKSRTRRANAKRHEAHLDRVRRAHELRAQGHTVREIARDARGERRAQGIRAPGRGADSGEAGRPSAGP